MAKPGGNDRVSPMNEIASQKFLHPDITAKGETRASVAFHRLDTLWINTGTLCNIECANCYIHSSPVDDRLAYITPEEAVRFFDEAAAIAAKWHGAPRNRLHGRRAIHEPRHDRDAGRCADARP